MKLKKNKFVIFYLFNIFLLLVILALAIPISRYLSKIDLKDNEFVTGQVVINPDAKSAEIINRNIKLNFVAKSMNEKKYKIAYHSACSMQHGQKIHKEPINLIKKTGNEVLEISDGHLCCGSAGTYNLLQNDIAKKLLKNKIINIEKIKPQIISTGNIGCITQIANGTKIPILHTVEIIDWYTGGPKPEVLK